MPTKPVFLIPPLLIFGLAWFIGQGVYLQQHQEVATIHRQLEEQRRMQAMREQVARSLQQAEQFHARLAPSPDTEWLVRQVTALAQTTGVELSSIAPQASKPVQEFTQLAVTLQLTTSYHRLGQFLSAVESLPVMIRVEQLEVRSAQD
ncbi:MAG: type 4a pilus biogenesis protein PilO, partial [Candidatus Omnitrophica bacterium]|nr:type 4a pilus biogenesis protein PilO [Candidatus Omnitrophota bacterium]